MDITSFLNSDLMIPDLKAATKEEAIKELVDKIYETRSVHGYPVTREEVYNEVIRRENLQSTGIGQGLAFPHARIEGWGEFAVAMGISEKGIDFTSVDKIPAKYVFLMISSMKQPYIILQTMAAFIRFLTTTTDGTNMLQDLSKVQKALEVAEKKEEEEREQVLASDITQPVEDVVNLETPIEEVTQKMHLKQIDILPIVDKDNKFCGQISCHDIFEYGIPDFFKQLRTISFVRHIDPFEKYFKLMKNLKVKDVFKKGTKPIKKDRTLIELIFDMTVKKKSKLFIIEDDGTLAGYVDRFSVIDKILFF